MISDELVDITVIELDRDLQFGPTLNMACVSNSVEDTYVGTKLDFYGYGQNSVVPGVLKGDGTAYQRVLGYEETQITKENAVSFHSHSADRSTIMDHGDSGGGATRDVDGKTMLVGVVSLVANGENGSPTWTSTEILMKVSAQSEKICEYAGVCTPRKEPNTELQVPIQLGNTGSNFVSTIPLLVLFYLAH